MKRVLAIFLILRALVVAEFGPRFQVILVEGHPHEFPAERSRAYCQFEGGKLTIAVSPAMFRDNEARIQGVLRHEFGHAVYFFEGYEDHSERQADELAEVLFGDLIYYDSDLVQTINPRNAVRPRPRSLG